MVSFTEKNLTSEAGDSCGVFARIVRGFCDFAVGVTILLFAAPFRAIWSADWRVLGADYGADRRADFRKKMRVFALALLEV